MEKADLLKKFYKEHFKDQFNIKYLEHNKIVSTELFQWNLESDEEFYQSMQNNFNHKNIDQLVKELF